MRRPLKSHYRWTRRTLRRLRAERGDAAGSILVRRDTTPPEVTLALLTARSMSAWVRIVVSVREPENTKFVRAGGVDEVSSPPRFGGFLMADAVETQGTVEFVSWDCGSSPATGCSRSTRARCRSLYLRAP